MSVLVENYTAGDNLPDNVYFDSNLLVAVFFSNHVLHQASTTFLLECVKKKIGIVISPYVIDEVWHILMSLLHKQKKGTKFNPKNRNHINDLTEEITKVTNNLFKLNNLSVLGVTNAEDLAKKSLEILSSQNTGSRDSFHLSFIYLNSINGFATNDSDFDDIESDDFDLKIIKVNQ